MSESPEVDLADATGAEGRYKRPCRFPLRFSLATLLLLATIVCLGVALWTTSRELDEARAEGEELRNEVQKYRNELGYLEISDPGRVHAIGVPVHGNLKWHWRVWLPDERSYRLHVVTGGVPKEGVPQRGTSSGSSSTIRSGEMLIYAAVQKDRLGQWVFRVEKGVGGDSSTIGIHQTHQRWLEGGPGWSTRQVSPAKTRSFEPGKPVVLVRLRVSELVETTPDGRTTRRAPDEPCDGLMVWIEEMP